ncbi:hypothetical protein [Bacillus thuringiensis]|uniref:hypothetical protein n=1 Tax=Bacillus thuringiensis TaxID=1428 RepID=UPI00119E35CF|nr:hypothetical protein [Bacillus thuringiensis]
MTNKNGLTCVELFINGSAVIEYECNAIPRIGETLDIHIDDVQDEFQVYDVKHHISKIKDGQLNIYVQVYAK